MAKYKVFPIDLRPTDGSLYVLIHRDGSFSFTRTKGKQSTITNPLGSTRDAVKLPPAIGWVRVAGLHRIIKDGVIKHDNAVD